MSNEILFNIIREPGCLSIAFSSTMENIDKADIETKTFLKHQKLENKTFDVCLVMREALTNAVKHGHKYDPIKIVQYGLTYQDNILTMEIEDQGQGFDWETTLNMYPNPDVDHGRGLTIMKQYFSSFVYNKKGNKLILKNTIQ